MITITTLGCYEDQLRCSMSGKKQTRQSILEESMLPSNNINDNRTQRPHFSCLRHASSRSCLIESPLSQCHSGYGCTVFTGFA